ncbi:class I SAM-dependent methyltransferase [Pararoseomonas indoligenes]|uniref:Class I SAM-dependent methyltransferase n=1 Tax=Roseomonas indoligenes TaxID=2820811 RepID=A0A940MZY1_9PROT|nr:class I SAM-dependent methyltransferase [Pararoseomonas indoligenes]
MTAGSDWGGGYVTDLEYIEGYYTQQSPSQLVLACTLRGIAADLPGPGEPVRYLELGCGQGIGALVLAAANPAWTVTAVDYNPAHIASARATAAAAGIGNVTFLEADLTTLAGSEAARAIPEADFTSMHGVWTWVSPEVRAGIVRLLAEKVRPGGVVHVSYNALPAWQSAIGMQRLVLEGGRRAARRSEAAVVAGLDLVRELNATGAHYLQTSPLVQQLLTATKDLAPEYLTHEYMNAHWAPAFHADVAAAMSGAKLDWVATAAPLESFPTLMLTEEQRALYERFDDTAMRELVMDTCLHRQFRHDVYVRGAHRLRSGERDERLAAMTLVPVVSPAELDTNLAVPAGTAEIGGGLKTLMAAALEGPTTVGALMARHPGVSNAAELVAVLVGTGQAQVTAGVAAQAPSADRLNRLLGGRVRSLLGPRGAGGLACSLTGAGLLAPKLLQFITARLLAGDREDAAGTWAEALSQGLDETGRQEVPALIARVLEQRVPLLRTLGVVPA